jgi:hypothetical protein
LGVADSTPAFAAARAASTIVNVPAGTYSLTAIPNHADGLWGPGVPKVNGVAYPLPMRPTRGSLWHLSRARLMTQIYTGSPLIFIGDSITNGAYGSTDHNTFAALITRFINEGIAIDEPLLTNFDATDTSGGPSFHGVTISGTPTYGTAGPLGKSRILPPGETMTFVGAHSDVDVFYQQASGAGTLAFAFNGGAAYKTINAAGSATSDVFSGTTATGQSASGTYTITNTHGSANVEITGLSRRGVVAGSLPRLNVFRIAHGGYQFQLYGASQAASAARMAAAFGGTAANAAIIWGLETNDAQGGTYASIKVEADAAIAAFVAAGFTQANMTGIAYWRWSSYPGGKSYEAGHAAVREVYAARSIRIIPLDGYDFITEGLSPSDGHPNDAGHSIAFNVIAEALAGIH